MLDNALPIKLLHDRVLVSDEGEEGERRSGGGIVIPATASVGRRLHWAQVVAVGPNVRHLEVGDRVLFDHEDLADVEIGSAVYTLMRERDVHAIASSRMENEGTGLYL